MNDKFKWNEDMYSTIFTVYIKIKKYDESCLLRYTYTYF